MRGKILEQLILVLFLLTAGAGPLMAGDPAYEAALLDYKANRIREAARALKNILTRDPKNKEAAMLLGTLYYQNHKAKKAFDWFERSDSSVLSNDTAFAWGSTYLEYEDQKKAAVGFKYLLKNKGPFRPYASYYLGVIAYNSSQWLKARRYFQRVNPEDLTEELRVNRRRYLADIKRQQDKLLEAIIGSADRASPNLEVTAPVVDQPATGKDTIPEESLEAPKANAQQVERPEEKKTWRHRIKPSLALTQQNELYDNHGLNHDDVNLLAHREGVSGVLNYGDARSGGILGGIDYNIGDIGYSARLDQVQYFTLESTSGLFTTQKSSNEDETSGFFILQPYLGWYFSDRTRLELSLSMRSYFPDYDSKQAWGQGSGQLGLRYEDSDTELGLELSVFQVFDESVSKKALDLAARAEVEEQFGEVRINLQAFGWQTDQAELVSRNRFRLVLADPQLRYRTGFVSEFGASGSIIFNLFWETSLQLRLETLAREPLNGVNINRLRSTDGVESVAYGANKSLASYNIPLGDSASLTGSAAYHLLSGYHYTDIDSDGGVLQEYKTDVEQIIYQAAGLVSFAEWIRLSGNYTITSNRFTGETVSRREFRRRNPDYVVDSAIYLEVGKSF